MPKFRLRVGPPPSTRKALQEGDRVYGMWAGIVSECEASKDGEEICTIEVDELDLHYVFTVTT